MDQWLVNVVAGVVANAVTAVAARAWQGTVADTSRLSGRIRLRIRKDSRLPAEIPEPSASTIAAYLASPDVAGVARGLVLARLTEQGSQTRLDDLKGQLTATIRFYSADDQSAAATADILFPALVSAVETATMATTKRRDPQLTLLPSSEVSSFAAELTGVRAVAELLASMVTTVSLDQVEHNESLLREAAETRHGHITPPHVGTTRRVPINDLYVVPNFVSRATATAEPTQPISFEAFTGGLHRTVLVGTPGGGKSTFAWKLAHDLATRGVSSHSGCPAPVIVSMHDFGLAKKDGRVSIRDYLQETIRNEYLVDAPHAVVEYMLVNGRVLVVFDGLDELVDTHERRAVTSDVEVFAAKYRATPVLATSREVGYDEAPLDERVFSSFRLAPFTEDQVADYAHKWFATDQELSAAERERKATSFVAESEGVRDLRSNPLMLALMCNIYRGDNYIPRNRPDVYDRCATMLFESWDRSRGIDIPLPFQAKLRPAMMFLAHAIYQDPALHSGITERRLIGLATDYLAARLYDGDLDEAGDAAHRFVDFCRGRAWVFTDVGTTPEGETLYQFTHRTFLEYFTAGHLTRIRPTVKQLEEVLLGPIGRQEWDVVAQLAYQMLDKNIEGAGDQLLVDLVEKALARPATPVLSQNYLAFAARCLEFLVPSAKTTRLVAEAAVGHAVDFAMAPKRLGDGGRRGAHARFGSGPQVVFAALAGAADENRQWIDTSLESKLRAIVLASDPATVTAALDTAHVLALAPTSSPTGARGDLERQKAWTQLAERVFEVSASRSAEVASTDYAAGYLMLQHELVTVSEFVEWHGTSALFRMYSPRTWPDVSLLSIADYALAEAIQRMGIKPARRHSVPNRFVDQLAAALMAAPSPWCWEKPGYIGYGLDWVMPARHARSGDNPAESDYPAFVVALALAAVAFDSISHGRVVGSLRQSELPMLSAIADFLEVRDRKASTREISTALDVLSLKPRERSWAEAWVSGATRAATLAESEPVRGHGRRSKENRPTEDPNS